VHPLTPWGEPRGVEVGGHVEVFDPAAVAAPGPAQVDNDVRFGERSEAKTGEVNAIDNAAEIGLNKPDYRQKLVGIARGAQQGSLDDYLADLDKRWNEAAGTAGS
jgi:hypothetical protein